MPALRMTTLAEQWRAARQHRGMVGSMGVVTRGAVFGYRGVLPQEWTALFGVALIAGVVDCLPREHRVRGRTVRAVTASAGDFPLAQWMRIRFQRIAFPERMALITFVGLGRHAEHGVARGVNLVAAGARHPIVVVWSTMPRKPGIGLVAPEAHSILCLDARSGVGGEANDLRQLAFDGALGNHAKASLSPGTD